MNKFLIAALLLTAHTGALALPLADDNNDIDIIYERDLSTEQVENDIGNTPIEIVARDSNDVADDTAPVGGPANGPPNGGGYGGGYRSSGGKGSSGHGGGYGGGRGYGGGQGSKGGNDGHGGGGQGNRGGDHGGQGGSKGSGKGGGHGGQGGTGGVVRVLAVERVVVVAMEAREAAKALAVAKAVEMAITRGQRLLGPKLDGDGHMLRSVEVEFTQGGLLSTASLKTLYSHSFSFPPVQHRRSNNRYKLQ
ncbi:hypothetical protein PG989_010217 [Apiospora arundinis]